MNTCTITDCGRTLPDSTRRRVCDRCAARLRARLHELQYQMPLLEASLQHDRAPTTGNRHGGRAHSPMPLRLDVVTLLGPGATTTLADPHGDQTGPLPIPAFLQSWAHAVAEHIGLRTARPEPDSHEGTGPTAEPALRPGGSWAGWLDAYLPWALTAPWAGDFHQELAELLARVRAITRTEPQRHLQDAPCPSCEAFALIDEDWQPYVECKACGLLLTHAEYADHAREVLPALYRTALAIVTAHNTQESQAS